MSMALRVVAGVVALVWQHPVVSCLVLLLFTPPFFPIVRFFSPLLVSTALFMLALFTMTGTPPSAESQQGEEPENWEFRRVADVQVWEDTPSHWMAWPRSWLESKLRNENWKGSALNDDNVTILEEATWTASSTSIVEEALALTSLAAPEKSSQMVLDELQSLKLRHDAVIVTESLSSSTDLDESSSELERIRSVLTQSKSGKLKQIETVGGLLEDKEQAEKTGVEMPARELAVLQLTTADQVDAVKEKLEGFTQSSGEIKQSPSNPQAPALDSPLFKATNGKSKQAKGGLDSEDDDSSSGEEEFSDSGSDSEFEIFPPVDPKKMKLHPPVKLDIQQLEKKLGTSLSQRTRAGASTGEISEVHQ